MTAAIRLEGLVKEYAGPPRVRALAGVDLEVREGEVFGLLGPNGAGKTTTVGICTTRVIPTSGRATVVGVDVLADPPRARRSIGVVSQYNTLDRSCTVRENLVYHCRYFGMGGAESAARADELLGQFHLTDRAAALPMQLSGGLAQRVQVARAIAHRPAVLVLDEPTAGLDPEQRLRFRDLVSRIGEGRTVLLSTHQTEDVSALCPHVVVVDRGRTVFDGSPSALTGTADGRVWLSPDRTPAARLAWRTAEGDVRNIGDAVPAGAQAVRPTLEDAYLLLVGEAATPEVAA
jgi:ABC-2 type transport system ATP-binding protein